MTIRSQGDGTYEEEVKMVASGAQKAVAITPNDSTNLTQVTKGIYVGVSGDLKVILRNDTEAITFTGISSGMIHPIEAKRVLATGTTATGVLGIN